MVSNSPLCELLSKRTVDSAFLCALSESDDLALQVWPRVLKWPPASEHVFEYYWPLCWELWGTVSNSCIYFCMTLFRAPLRCVLLVMQLPSLCFRVALFKWMPSFGVFVLCTVKSCLPSAWVLLLPPQEASR